MSFTDDDLKRLKEMISDTHALWVNGENAANPISALIARLEAAEAVIHANYGDDGEGTEAEIVRLSGKTGFCTECERLARELASAKGEERFLCPDCETPLRAIKRMDQEIYWEHPVYACPAIIQKELTAARATLNVDSKPSTITLDGGNK